jgi:hypothetical protein
MPALSTALDALAATAISGITHHFSASEPPETLTRAQLPALVTYLSEVGDKRLFGERGDSFHDIAFPQGGREAAFVVTQLLLIAPIEAGVGLRSHTPRLIAALDSYFEAFAAAPTLNGALREPIRLTVQIGTFTVGGIAYHGAALRHLWRVGY